MDTSTMEMDAQKAKTEEETDKKCPSCAGVMTYDPATGGLACPFCGHTEQIKKEEKKAERATEQDFFAAENTANCDWGVKKKVVICKACAAESIYDDLQTSAVCPFCGSNQVMESHTEDTIAPGGVVPFKVSAEQASDLFKTWIGKKWFCPKLAKESAKPKEFKGIYLPYWTFDAETTSDYTARYGIDHTYTDSEGNTKTRTDWHNTSGVYREFINDQPVLASKNHDSNMLSQLEPFDTEDNKTYEPEYVAGFVAERYSIGLKDAWEIAKGKIKSRLKNGISNKVRREHNADHVGNINMKTVYEDIKYKYLLLPIWMSSFKYQDKVYHFMVNGQNGKIAGKTPISPIRVAIAVIAGLVLLGLIMYITN